MKNILYLLLLVSTACFSQRISDLPAVSTPMTGAELLPVVQGGVTKKATVLNFSSQFVPLTLTGNTTIATGGFYLRLQGTGVQNPMLSLDAPNNVRKSLSFRTGNLERWQIHTENNETGISNIGTDLHFERYNDAGTFIDVPMGILRTDGRTFFEKVPFVAVGTAVTTTGTNDNTIATAAFVQQEANTRVATTITNGVTTSAPNQDVVFDALMNSYRTVTTSHTLDATDLTALNGAKRYTISVNSAANVNFTIPEDATQDFPDGTEIKVIPINDGVITYVPSGTVTLTASGGDFLSRGINAPTVLEKTGNNAWKLYNGNPPDIVLAQSTYTPSLTNTTNVAASTAFLCTYYRVGNSCTVAGRVEIDPTAAAPTSTVLGIGLPIPSLFTTAFQAGGTANSIDVAGQGGGIRSDATNDRIELVLMAENIANSVYYFTFTYEILE